MATVLQFCTSPDVEKRVTAFSGPMNQKSCSKFDMHRTPGGMVFESVCNRGGITVSSTGTMSGDFQTHYHLDVASHMSPAAPGRPGDSHVSMDGKWLGPCPAGRKPGDMVMPGGMVVNIDRAR